MARPICSSGTASTMAQGIISERGSSSVTSSPIFAYHRRYLDFAEDAITVQRGVIVRQIPSQHYEASLVSGTVSTLVVFSSQLVRRVDRRRHHFDVDRSRPRPTATVNICHGIGVVCGSRRCRRRARKRPGWPSQTSSQQVTPARENTSTEEYLSLSEQPVTPPTQSPCQPHTRKRRPVRIGGGACTSMLIGAGHESLLPLTSVTV